MGSDCPSRKTRESALCQPSWYSYLITTSSKHTAVFYSRVLEGKISRDVVITRIKRLMTIMGHHVHGGHVDQLVAKDRECRSEKRQEEE